MTAATLCDGCEQVVKGTPEKVGHAQQNDYCPSCADKANAMMDEMNKLHDEVTTTWETKLAEIKSNYRNELKLIPDEYPEE